MNRDSRTDLLNRCRSICNIAKMNRDSPLLEICMLKLAENPGFSQIQYVMSSRKTKIRESISGMLQIGLLYYLDEQRFANQSLISLRNSMINYTVWNLDTQ